MNVTPPRNIFLLVCAAILVGAGLYLATGQRSENRSESQPAAKTEATAPTEASGGDSAVAAPGEAASTGQNQWAASDRKNRPDFFGLNGAVQLEQVPEGRFRNELSRLSETARRYALDKLGRLQVPLNDVESLSVEANGQLFYQCTPPRLPPPPALVALAEHNEASAGLPGAPEKSEAAAEVPISAAPIRHSRPGATKVIYLDFNGHTISGTAWNQERGSVGDANYRPAVASYVAKPFNTEGNPQTFSDAEQSLIIKVWERVAEDYRGFDVDVTTQEPASFTANTGRILVTDNVDANAVLMPSSSGSGVAYLDVFGDFNYTSYYSPALVYANQNYNYASYIAETASHEMGHNLSLSHDGTTSGDEYYNGHGSGDTSWNTIMGGAFSENVTQWSKGEYFDSNNPEDDLAEIAARLSYVPDDHADSNGSAAPLAVNGLTVSGSGVISQTGEADRFSFESGAGAITLSATTFRSSSQSHGGNLDVVLELYDTGGSLVASANVDGITDATLNATVSGGTYFLRVFGAGSGTPLTDSPSGYTNYGSLGQYTISGTLVSTTPVAPSITSQPADQAVYEGQSAQFSVAASGYPAPSFQWRKGGVNIGGATNNTYAVASAAIGDAGSYSCVATNVAGVATSNAATLAVTPTSPPAFTSHPSSQTITEGASVTFTAVASGIPAATYRWRKEGINISGATGASLTISNATGGDTGTYDVVASNLAGSVTSNVAILTVNAPAAITVLSPARQVIHPGQGFTLSTQATGVGPLSYQWTHNGHPVNGATANTLTLSSATRADSGYYLLNVTNSFGMRRSSPLFVTVAPETTELVSWNFSYHIPANFTNVIAVAGGGLVLRADGTVFDLNKTTGLAAVPEGLSNVVAISSLGHYGMPGHSMAIKADGTVVAWGFGQSYGETLVPAGLNDVVGISAGGYHSLAVKSDGTVVAWGRNDKGATSVPSGLSNVVLVAAGWSHSLALKADGTVVAWGANESGQATVPADLTDVVSLAAGPDTCLALRRNGTVVGWGAYTSQQLTAMASRTDIAAISVNGYFLNNDGTLSGGAGNLTSVIGIPLEYSNNLALRDPSWVDRLPTIDSQPTSQTVSVGTAVTFSCAASGKPSPTFQWNKGGVNIAGATSNSYTIPSATLSDFGDYAVTASNSVGSVTSNVATLTQGIIPVGFDVTSYLARYPDVAAVYGTNSYAAWIHYRDYGIYQGEVFDELFRVEEYLSLYPELLTVFGSDLGGALMHWLTQGNIEGRLGRIPLVFSAQGYFDRNPDVAAAAGNNALLAWAHYWLYGIYEGRAYDDELDVFQYLAINADLTAAFVSDWRAAALHWMRYGRTEGRLGRIPLIFNVTEYLNRSPDVAAVWGTHPTTVFLHYWGFGIDEGRTFDDEFRPAEYLALNLDLAAVFGTDKRGAFKHWVRYGRSEGRPGRNP